MRSEIQGPTRWTEANQAGVEVEGHLGHRLNLLEKKEQPGAHPTPTPKCWQTASGREDRPTVWMLLDVSPLTWTRSAQKELKASLIIVFCDMYSTNIKDVTTEHIALVATLAALVTMKKSTGVVL